MQFSIILVRTPEETVAAILPRLSRSFVHCIRLCTPFGPIFCLPTTAQLTAVPFSEQRCVHTSRQDRLLCLTLIVSASAGKHFRCQNNKKYIPILREVLMTHKFPDFRISFNYLKGQNRDNKCTLHGTKLPSPLANSASHNRGLRPQR